MTPQERQLLESLALRISNTPPPQKDPEADHVIQERIGCRPDALYILAQTALIQEMALNQANERLHDLQQQLYAQQGQQSQPRTSFLGRLFGGDSGQYQQPQYGGQQYGAPQYQPPQYGAPQYAPQQFGGAPSFLRSAATTATGVAAGALAFEGIEALLGHHSYGGFGGGGSEFLQGAPQETVINNYYDDSGSGDNSNDSSDNSDYSDDSSGGDSSV